MSAETVTLIEVGPRDGLQNEKDFVPTEFKITFIKALKSANIKEMELTSFFSPKWVPQMKDANIVAEATLNRKERNFILVQNQKGMERFYALNGQHVAVFVGVSSTFNQHNINKTTKESLNELKPVILELKSKGKFVRACISTAFYCLFEGKIKVSDLVTLCEQFAHLGVDELSIADTIGKANPRDVKERFMLLKSNLPKNLLITAHFHNTLGTALANIYASLETGINRFDTSAGGLGGCPFAPLATGNVATEDVIYMLHELGIDTGINAEQLYKAIDLIKPHISRSLDSKLYTLREPILLKKG